MGLLILFIATAAGLCLIGTAALLHGLSHPPRTTLGGALARGLPADPGELGLAFEEAVLQLTDGSDTAAWIVSGERPDGPTVIVTHGWGDSRYGSQLWAPLVVPYADRVVLYDMRGHGDARARTSRCGLVEPDDLRAIMDQLGVERCVLLGYSMGACVSIVAAAKDAQAGATRVRGVLADGVYRWWDEPIAGLFRLRRWPRQPLCWLAGAWMWLTNAEFRRFDRAGWAAKLGCPLRAMHGTADPICPVTSAQAVVAAAPDGAIELFEDAGHLDLATADPPRYRRIVAQFMETLA
jgi:pimeloyl-ACP methyl ester carboxylesterase